MSVRHCPAWLVSAPASGQGKTTVTAVLARYHRNRGRRVRVFKTGPDFLDPMILERASGNPVYQLDLWMVGEAPCKQLLYDAAGEADLILIEGVMGLFDGEPSSADLARVFDVPVLAVIDARAMAQSFGAVAHGLATYQANLPFAGVLANRVASPTHGRMLAQSVLPGLHYFGGLARNPAMQLPDRHLGLVQAQEIADLEERLEVGASAVAETGLTALPETVGFEPVTLPAPPRLLDGAHIGVARDAAFSFLYPHNLDLLRAMGAELHFFSPLTDTSLPPMDSLYLPGGYPELHLASLQNNHGMKAAVRAHAAAGKPMYAECGGMLYLLESLADKDGNRAAMVGLLPGHAVMQERLAALGLQEVALPQGTLRGHTFHHSRLESPLTPHARAHGPHGEPGEAVYRNGRLLASYVHLHFASNPEAAARLFTP